MRLSEKKVNLAIEIFKIIVGVDWYKYIAECEKKSLFV